ncbi:MAG: hypothetical protein ABIO70_10765 [Pseudomonadota bacterium]
MQRLPVVAADRLLYAMEPLAINEIHLVVDFDAAPDPVPLAEALRRLLDLEPILGCRLVTGFWGAHWERLPAAALDDFALEIGGNEASFLARRRDPRAGPQLEARLVGERLILKVSHLAGDAGAVKALGYRLAALVRGEDDGQVREGDRGAFQVLHLLHPRHWGAHLRTAARELWALGWPPKSAGLLTGAVPDEQFEVRTLHLDAPRVAACRALAEAHGATLNDLVAAALLRALARVAAPGLPLRLLDTVDLRRYISDVGSLPTCNQSSFFGIAPGEVGPDLPTALTRTRSWTAALKEGRPGAWYLLTWGPLLRGLPFGLGVPLLRGYMLRQAARGANPPIFTNMGRIDERRLEFGSLTVGTAWMIVPLFRPPGVGCGISGFRDSLTLTQGFSGGPAVAAKVDAWLRAFLEEIEGA